MLALITLHIEVSKISKDVYMYNPFTDQDADAYLFCSFPDEANENGMVEEVKKRFFSNAGFITGEQVDEKKRQWEAFLENNKVNGMAQIFPEGNKLHLLVYGNLCILHFRNNEPLKRLTGSFGKVQSERMEIEKDDVVMVVLNSFSSTGFDALYASEMFPMLFVDAVGDAKTLMAKAPKLTERIRAIRPSSGAHVRKDWEAIVYPTSTESELSPNNPTDSASGTTGKPYPSTKTDIGKKEKTKTFISGYPVYKPNKEAEVVQEERPSFFDKMKDRLQSFKVSGVFWGILCFVLGFILVLFIMYLLMPDNDFFKHLFMKQPQ